MRVIRVIMKYAIVLPALYLGALYVVAVHLCALPTQASITGSPPPGFLDHWTGWASVALVGVFALIVTAAALMRARPVAEGVVLRAWDYAQRQPKGSFMRWWLEKRIVSIGRMKLGLRRVTTPKGVVNKIRGVESVKQKPAYDGPRVVWNNDRMKEAA